jgi:hypothetical protein
MIQDIDDIFEFLIKKRLYIIHDDHDHCKLCDEYIRHNNRDYHLDSMFHIHNENEYFDNNDVQEISIFNDKEECCICYEDIEEGCRTKCCNKYFHNNCVERWFEINNNCPLCRHINPEIIHASYINYNSMSIKDIKKICKENNIDINSFEGTPDFKKRAISLIVNKK